MAQRHPSLDDRYDPAVHIVDYDPAWPVLAGEELRRIKEGLGEVAARLEHVGSTAVPGLAAPDLHFFARLPQRTAAQHPEDRLAYIDGKDEYVTQLEARAVEWARGRG
jgi:GrpB-like predicted nucleotidyltransferase (UPF0157 family)